MWSLVLVAAAQLVSTTAYAQATDTATNATASSAESADDAARRVFSSGRESYAAGRFEEAFLAFQQAYALSHRPALLFNVGQAADRLRRDREAITAFEQYVAEVPDATNRQEVEARLSVLRAEVARRQALEDAASRPSTPPTDTGSHSIVEEWWFWTLIGVVAVGGGVTIGIVAGSRDELATPTPGDFGPGGVVVALRAF